MSSSYGLGHVKTCQNCARAKIRCPRAPNSSICDRCHRLDKKCYFRPARSRYNPAKNKTRIEALEDKVNQLLTQAGNNQQLAQHPPSHPANTPESDDQSTDQQPQDFIDRGIVTFQEAEALVATFRDILMPHFPFVILSPEATLSRLRVEKPFLLLSVIMVSSYKTLPSQRGLEETFQAAVADWMLFAHTPSMDVLQGLLVGLAWLQHQSKHLRFSSCLHLAWSIVGDLRLDRLPETRSSYLRIAARGLSPAQSSTVYSGQEKRRAVVGCYVLSSSRSTILQKDRMMTRLPYIEKYALDLAQASEVPSDRYLIYLVQMQQILEQIDDAVAATVQSEVEINMHAFQAQIDEYKKKLPATVAHSALVQFQVHSLELFLCQTCLFDKNGSATFSSSSMARTPADARLPSHLQSGQQPLDLSSFQVEFLGRGLTVVKDFFDYFLTLPPETCRLICHTQWLQTGFNLVLGCKLAVTGSNYAARSTHLKTLCDTLNMPQILRDVLQRLQRINKDRLNTDGKQDSKCFYEIWLWRIHEWFEQKYYLVCPKMAPQIPKELSDSNTTSSTILTNASLPRDPQILEGYSNGQGPREDEIGSWPDFLWSISTDNILNGCMEFMDMPFDPLEHGYDGLLS